MRRHLGHTQEELDDMEHTMAVNNQRGYMLYLEQKIDFELAHEDICELIEEALERCKWMENFLGDDPIEYISNIVDDMRTRIAGPPIPPERQRSPSANLRRRVFERDAYRCRHCGGYEKLNADHVVPFSKGGLTTFENLQTLCGKCNGIKGNKDEPSSRGTTR